MKKIASFTVNHDKLQKGMYVSRIDGDVVTYDIRMKTPNAGDYLTNGALHTFEHLFATYARNSALSDAVIYVGPMGCRTGFYFLLRDSVSRAEALRLVQESFAFIEAFEGRFRAAAARNAATISSTTCRAQASRGGVWAECWPTGRRRRWTTKRDPTENG